MAYADHAGRGYRFFHCALIAIGKQYLTVAVNNQQKCFSGAVPTSKFFATVSPGCTTLLEISDRLTERLLFCVHFSSFVTAQSHKDYAHY